MKGDIVEHSAVVIDGSGARKVPVQDFDGGRVSDSKEAKPTLKIPALPPRPQITKPDWRKDWDEELAKYSETHLTPRHVQKELTAAREGLERCDRSWEQTVKDVTDARENIDSVREEILQAEKDAVEAVRRKEAAEARYGNMKSVINFEEFQLRNAKEQIVRRMYDFSKYLEEHC
jgi:hypothetical protein